MKKFVVGLFLLLIGSCSFAIMNDKDKFERRGCCSHHGGVCGCTHGRIVCCDGTYSPSCRCD